MNTKSYRHLFFDLDHTLWDFEANSTETLNELFEKHGLSDVVESKAIFINTYQVINKQLWELHHQKLIDKKSLRLSRFALTLEKLNVHNLQLSMKLADDYVKLSPHKGKLFPDTHEVLSALSKKFALHLITNGFKEVQRIKIQTSDLEKYFEHIFISEEVGHTKPDAALFNHAMRIAKTNNKQSMMIGDNYEADILGAAGVGMDTVFFNPERISNDYKSTYQIFELKELLDLLH